MLNSLRNREREYHIFSTERWGRDCVFNGGCVSNSFGMNRDSHNRLFYLYVLYSHFRPRDGTTENCFFQISSYACVSACISMHISMYNL